MTDDEHRSEEAIREEIAGLMFAALINLDRDVDRIIKKTGLPREEDEWLDEETPHP